MKIKIVTEKEPWEFFLDTPEAKKINNSPLELLKAYHEFLQTRGEAEGTCFICERKFRPRIKEDTPSAPKDKKGTKLDVA